ncbi:MAG: thiolase family protein [Planctomycetota bacterium]
MALEKSFIPYGTYWSTPFCRWQGALSGINAVELAAGSATRFLGGRDISVEQFDGLVLGMTVPQKQSFYGAPWLGALIGAPGITGPTVSQACATSVRAVATAAMELEVGSRSNVLVVACDRTSNGPHIYYPNPTGIGGKGDTEEWVWDNFNRDPYAKCPMISTAENVAKEAGISREEQDEMTLIRHEQYQDSLADGRAFQKKYMLGVEIPKGRKKTLLVEEDEGVFPTTKEGLGGLKPMLEGGSVTFGSQTFPADGNAGLVVCSRDRAKALAQGGPTIQILGFGDARVKKAFMPMAAVPAARAALANAGVNQADVKVLKTHNPFAVNDVYFCREMKLKPEEVNRFGSPLIYGHPQGPTGLRAMIEMIEELRLAGGGLGLFSGCAAGDTAMALVVRVG